MAHPGEVAGGARVYGDGMESPAASRRYLVEVAARARMREMGGHMDTTTRGTTDPAKAAERAMWRQGDYHLFAKRMVWGFGPRLVAACGISAGQRVLDVAAGTGNVAIRAAEAGASVVASDLTPENFEAGRREAEARGVELEWVEADAEALPFGDGEFDVVTSSAGAIFAPDHQAVADELVRVCRPGGTIGMINFTPEGLAREFFELFGRYAPSPPPGALPVVLWGSEEHVRDLFGNRVSSLELTREQYVERSPGGPADYIDFFKANFGPVAALYAFLADEPERVTELDREALQFATRSNRGAPGGAAEYHYEYLLVVARKREGPVR